MKQLFNKKNRIILPTTFVLDYIFNVVLTTTFEPNLLTRFVLSSIFVLSVLVLSSKLYDKYTQPKKQIL
jgi:putative effector of murein hydrolase